MNTQNKRSSEEIDILYFFNPLLKGFNAAKKNTAVYRAHFRRNILLFLAIFVLVSLAGYALRYILPAYYNTSATFISHHFPAGYYNLQVQELKELAGNTKNNALLAEKLNIPVAAASKIRNIETEPADHLVYMYRNDTIAAAAFRVQLTATDLSGLDQIQQGLQLYLENNEFSRKRKESRKKTLGLLKNNLEEKSRNLDSLKEVVSADLSAGRPGQVIVLGQPVIPIQVYELQTRYYKELLEIEEDLGLLENIELVQPFTKTAVAGVPNANRYFKYSIIAGFLLALLITGFVGRRW
jgi:hypothetical protein